MTRGVKYSSIQVYMELMISGGCELCSRPSPSTHTKTDGHDKTELRFNSTFTLHPQEMITAESHLINACLCVCDQRDLEDLHKHSPPATHT